MNTQTLLSIAFPVLALLAVGCSHEEDELTLARRNYQGSALRLDGYYYRDTDSDSIRSILFLYRNGILLDGGGHKYSDIGKYEEWFASGKYYDLTKDHETSWSTFHIDSPSITYELWVPISTWHVYKYTGTILSDTTFHITHAEDIDESETYSYNKDDYYRFKAFSPKPDSVVSFIP